MMSIGGNQVPVVSSNSVNTSVRQNKRRYLCQTLGEESFLLCKNFFESIWSSDAPYKVFMARRCLNLMYIFYSCAEDKWRNDTLESSFFSDGALLSNVPEIAAAYRESYIIPEILIVDEILIHGRTFNKLITELIERIYDSLLDEGVRVEKSRLEKDVLSSVRIRVILQSNKPLLMYGRYQKNLKAETICSTHKWHQFSAGVSQVIAGGVIANTCFVPSLEMRVFDEESRERLYRHISGRADLMTPPFPYRNRFFEKAWVYPVASPDGAVRAIYTLRVVPSEMDGTRMMVPFVIYSEVRADRGDLRRRMLRKLFPYFDDETRISAEKACRYWKEDSPAWMDAFTLILSQNLLLLLLQDCEVSDWERGIDYGKIRMSFRSRANRDTRSFFDNIAKRKTPWMTLERMNEMMLDLTLDLEPLFYVPRLEKYAAAFPDHVERYIDLVDDSIGDILSEYGQLSEYHAYRQRVGREFPSGLGVANRSVTDILCELDGRIGRELSLVMSRREFLSCAISVLLRYMDKGAAATALSYDEDEESEGYGNMCRAGEQSLFILPQRYSCYLPILGVMEQDCLRNLERLVYRMNKFLNPILGPQMTENLVRFVEGLYRMGQYLKDWDIDMSGWVEWQWEKPEKDEALMPKEIQRRNMQQLFRDLRIQSNLLDQYIKFTKK